MFIAWENSRHFALPVLVSPPNDVRETSLPRSGLCFWLAENLHHSIRSISQIWVVTRYQYGISALASQMSFRWETSGGVAKCRLFSQAINILKESKLRHYLCSFCPQKAQKLSSQLAFRPHFVQKCIDAGLSSPLGELEPALALLGGEANTASIEKG